MKRFIALSVIIVGVLWGTPYEDYRPSIYELQIIKADDWKMEINLFQEEYFSIDTFMIKNKSDSAMVLNYTIYDSVYFDQGKILVVTPDDLSKPLNFDKDNDIITLESFLNGEKFTTNTVKLGSYPGSLLHNIDSSQSICWDMLFCEHYKSNSPTFGSDNEADVAIIYGKIYDADNVAITNSAASFYHYPEPLMAYNYEPLDENGFYKAIYHSRSYSFKGFGIWQDDEYQYLEVNPVDINLEPGDSIEVNFYASTVSITPVIKNNIISLFNYPHPASSYTWINIDNTDVEASAMRVDVYALNGRKVDSFIPSANQCLYDCSKLPQGSYFMSLRSGKQILATKKLQILK